MGPNAYYPWIRDADGKFDLDTWDSAFWDRDAQVGPGNARTGASSWEFVIFSEYPKGGWRGIWWQGGNGNYLISWNKNFNTNGVFSANSAGDFYPQFFDLSYQESGKSLQGYQQALIDKSHQRAECFRQCLFPGP